ncbi:ATP-binding protein [Streptomyces sp. NPDC056390]|uniref:ATP-binding protein n=1 Tax=Streptomyces sp. NPDC056390 TaxID=3345806 RepID=UPI0035DCDBD4
MKPTPPARYDSTAQVPSLDLKPVPPQGLLTAHPEAGTCLPRRRRVALPGASRSSVACARAHAVDALREWQVDDDIVEALRLIVSEFVTNAVVHTASRTIEITVSVTATEAIVTVTDQGLFGTPIAREARPGEEHGRGLALVDTLATRWGSTPLADGTQVEAAVTLPEQMAGAL